MNAPPLTLRLARPDEDAAIIAFLDEHWGAKHPLLHIPEFFDFYYRPFGPDGPLQFAVAEQAGRIAAAAGYIRANRLDPPDVWISIWCAAKFASGAGLELLNAMRGLIPAREIACNNIRPRVMPLYKFVGYTAGRLPHYYRLADRSEYRVARIAEKTILPAGGDTLLRPLRTEDELLASGYTPDASRLPCKDLWYLARRYYRYPHQHYDVWGSVEDADVENGTVTALLVTRCIPVNGTCVLRIVDYTGAPDAFCRLGAAIHGLMAECGAEYVDCYCAGIPAGTMAEAGFCERTADDANILPNYLTPPLYENTEYYYSAWEPQGFTMFKADGDQDRPNLSAE